MSHKRGPWSDAENAELVHLVCTQGPFNWVRIADLIGTRSPKQCRERYHQNLKPSLNHEPITPAEGALIEKLVAERGKRWAEIARRLHGRSDNAVKNWWNGSMNRHRRQMIRRRSSEQWPQQPFDRTQHHLAPARPQPSLAEMRPLNTMAAGYAAAHIERALPSPAGSEASRTGSYDGPPSLISDNGSAYSISPRLATSPRFALPPIDTMPMPDPRPSCPTPSSPPDSMSAMSECIAVPPEPKSQSLGFPYTSCYRKEPAQSRWPGQLHTPSAQPQIQLPPLNLSYGNEAHPERDSRMKLSALMD